MAAATVTNPKLLAQMLKKAEGDLRNREDGVVPVQGGGGLFPFGDVFTIPATSVDDVNDIQRLWQFPAGAYIWDLRATPSDMDTGAAALVYSLLVTDAADSTLVTLVSGSTNGQAAAGSDRILSAAVGKFVGGSYLSLKVTTAAATPAAGTIKVVGLISLGILTYVGGGKPYMLDAGV